MNIYEKIKARREQLGLTMEDVANILGVNKSTISRYESDQIKKMPIDFIEPLAKILQCTPEYLMGWEDELPENAFPIKTGEAFRIGIYNQIPASCGPGSCADESNIVDYISLPTSIYKFNKHKKYFGQIAEGDSMINAGIEDGDILIFESYDNPEDNMIGVFCVNDHTCYCKRFKKVDNKYYLVSANENYLPIEITPDMDFRMVGLLKYVVKEYEWGV